MKSGFVAIIGRPNVGKSTMLNNILNFQLSIVSDKPQTTRDEIRGIYNDATTQIVFLDTPGIHKPKDMMGEEMNVRSYKSIRDADLILFLKPINEKIGPGDEWIYKHLVKVPMEKKIGILTKIDLVPDHEERTVAAEKLKALGFPLVLGLSSTIRNSVINLLQVIKGKLPEGPRYYERDMVTDKSMRFIAKEVIRESAIELVKDELPHSIAVAIEEFKETENKINIRAFLVVGRKSQKGMLIGSSGKLIRTISKNSTMKLKNIFDVKVRMDLKVKVQEKWYKNPDKLKQLGY